MKSIKQPTSSLMLLALNYLCYSQVKQIETWPIGMPVSYIHFYSDNTYSIDNLGIWSYRNMETVGIANDTNGNLLFQCNGSRIANAQLQILENGDSITDNGFYDWAYPGTGIPQSVIALPRQNNTYWVFYYSYYDSASNSPSPDRLYYAIVDMNANGGAGRVTVKKQAIYKGVMGDCRLTAVRHANGRDWWLVNHGYSNNVYNKWLVSPDSIYGPYQQAIGAPDAEPDVIGSARFTEDGSKYATGTMSSYLSIFDFNRCAGMFSNPQSIEVYADPPWEVVPGSSAVNGLCWSPSGRFLYVNTLKYILQYDTWADTIANSRILIAEYDTTYANSAPFSAMTITPHKNIIISNYQGVEPNSHYHIIHNPDSAGSGCQFEKEALPIPGSYDNIYLPNLVNLKLGADSTSLCDTIVLSSPTPEGGVHTVRVFPNPATVWVAIEVNNNRYFSGTLTIVNQLGQTVYENKQYDGATVIKVNGWPQGMYLYNIKSKGSVVASGKVVVER